MIEFNPLTGGCLCGDVRYSIAAEPIATGHCACENCRKACGAEHATMFAVPADAAGVTGATSSFVYSADSGTAITRHFCPNCGGHAWTENSRMAHLRMFPVGGLDDISRVRPSVFVYHASKAPWDAAGERLETFDENLPFV